MWIYTKAGAYSIVELKEDGVPTFEDEPGGALLMCRARKREHLEALGYTRMQINSTPHNDYPFRVFVRRDEIADRIRRAVYQIDYGNFKDAASKEGMPSDMLFDIWSATHKSLDPRNNGDSDNE